MLFFDYHLHTARCGHASGTMQQYLNAARSRGLREVGFADHVPMYWLPMNNRSSELAMNANELSRYIEDVYNLQKTNSDIVIKLGLEVDYIPGYEKKAKQILDNLPLDYILGSVHYIDGWGFDNPDFMYVYDRWDLFELYERYFNILCAAAKSKLFDVIAHPDLIKKFGFKPENDIVEFYEEAAKTFAENGVCVEVNTAGLRVPAKEIYPCYEFLKFIYKYDVPVTVGSDAHKPEHVGYGFKTALDLIRSVGYKYVVLFNRRRRIELKI